MSCAPDIGKIREKRDDIAVAAFGISERPRLMLRQGGVEELCERDGLFHPIDRDHSIAESNAYTVSHGHCHFPRATERSL